MNENHLVKVGAPEAVVSDQKFVTLWRNGETISVPASAVAALSKDGWLENSPADIASITNEVRLFADQVATNVEHFVKEVQKDGNIDTHDGAIYEAAMTAKRQLDSKLNNLLYLIHSVYPVKQDVGIVMTDPEGVQREVDPGQEQEYLANGWRK